jgi:hypothetical protein
LRAEWSRLDTPGRIEGLAQRHLALKPITPVQFDNFDRLPDRPIVTPPSDEPASAMSAPAPDATGSIAPRAPR